VALSPPTGHPSASASSSAISAEPTSPTLAEELAAAIPAVVVADTDVAELPDAADPPVREASPKPAKPRRKKGKGRPGRKLFQHDRALGVRFVAGADEAGRGCLAGPLVAAAVLFDYDRLGPREVRALSLLNDSKQHTEQAREALYPIVLRIATRVAVVSRSAGGIDRRGLHKTNLAALRESLLKVAVGRDGVMCLSDGFPVGDLEGHTGRAIVEGDATSAAIAAASIIAKVTRDRFMHRADARHPGWEFAAHVGYSTPEHRDAIQRHGVSPLHRMSFQSTAYQQLAL
jgi:ribonuclease HII